MEVYDLHCDTISAIYEGRKDGKDLSLASSSLQVDLEKMEKGDYRLQTFAIFLDRANTENCFATAGEMTELFKKELEKNRDKISQVYTYQDIQRNKAEGKMSALLSLEEGGIFEKAPEDLRWFYDQGARIATLTWNHENELAYPNCQGDPFKDHPWSWGEERGLKEKGIQALEQMESLGMIPDVSHLSADEFQFLGHVVDRRPLHEQRNDRNEKHRIEDERGIIDSRGQRIGRKDNRDSSAQSDP